MRDLATFLLDAANSGVYAAPAAVTALRKRADACGLAWMELDLAGVADKGTFLARCQAAFNLPASFGHNWDALADCFEDLSWQPARGYVVLCRDGAEFARRAPQDHALGLEILAAAATYWVASEKPFFVLLDAQTRAKRRLKSLPE